MTVRRSVLNMTSRRDRSAPVLVPDPADHYLPLTASAAYLGMHRDTLRRAIDRGELPAIKVGPRGDLRIRRRDLDAYGSTA